VPGPATAGDVDAARPPGDDRPGRRAVTRRKAVLVAAVTSGAMAVVLAVAVGWLSPHSAAEPDKDSVSAVHRVHKTVASAPPPAPASVQALDPAAFSRGACLALAPTSGDNHLTVFLDAGHGGPDPGGVGVTEAGATVTEAPVNLRIELDTAALLRARGYRVVVSRSRDSTVVRLTPAMRSGKLLSPAGVHADVAARDRCANLGRANILIGIYMNAGYGAGCITDYDAARPFSAENRTLAKLLQHDVLSAMNARGWDIPDGGARNDIGMGSAITAADLAYGHLMLLGPAKAGYFSTPSQMPGALIEPLFLTDPFEGSIAARTHGQQVIAGGIAAAVGQYFSRS
jgi:N-acetylmuramoyl-L-alanine amidase